MKKSIALLILTSLAAASFAGPFAAQAGPRSSFTAEQLEKSIAGFCQDYETTLADPKAGFSSEDLKTMAKEIADQVAYSEPERFNDIIGHVLAEYYHYPRHRSCLSSLIASLFVPNETEAKRGEEAALVRDLKGYKESAVTKVVDKVFFAFTVAYTFEFGRGVWRTRGSGLKGLELFGSKVRLIGEGYKSVAKYPWLMKAGVAGAGAGVGFAEVIYDAIRTQKSDPRPLLADLQRDIIRARAGTVAETLAFLTRLQAAADKDLLAKAELHRTLVAQADTDVAMVMAELAPIGEDAQFKPELEPLVEDIIACRKLVNKLMARLGPDSGGIHAAPSDPLLP